MSLAATLPAFPWDTLAAAKAAAASHPDGIVDLSIGTPVDATPDVARAALRAAADSPGYPLTAGTEELRTAIAEYLGRRWGAGAVSPDATMPVIGTKELVAWLPTLLGLGGDDVVVYPRVAYPTYAVGARLAGCQLIAADDPAELGDLRPALVWLNSPANPTGQVLDPDTLADRVRWARERGAVVASDECYTEFGWDAEPFSVLHSYVSQGRHQGLLAVHSLSKRSNVAGYRAGFVAGDPALVAALLAVRKHAGMLVPGPVQAAMVALLADHDHVEVQRQRYLARRELLWAALTEAGFRIDHSAGSLYLWATRGEPCRVTVDWLAARGILAAPGDFYGAHATEHVRFALTATDERIQAAVERLRAA